MKYAIRDVKHLAMQDKLITANYLTHWYSIIILRILVKVLLIESVGFLNHSMTTGCQSACMLHYAHYNFCLNCGMNNIAMEMHFGNEMYTHLVEGSSSLVSLGFPLEISFWVVV